MLLKTSKPIYTYRPCPPQRGASAVRVLIATASRDHRQSRSSPARAVRVCSSYAAQAQPVGQRRCATGGSEAIVVSEGRPTQRRSQLASLRIKYRDHDGRVGRKACI